MKKCIAVTQRVEYVKAIKERRDALSQEWAELAEICGFVPLILPNRLSMAKEMLQKIPPDGILLTGGNDIGDAPERDETERFLIQRAAEARIPLLGVCRGMQMILTYFGTPLQKVEGHVRVEHPLSNGDVVNSFHSWGTTECKEPLVPQTRSGDGILEAVRHQNCPWIHGIMWHPERYHPSRERDVQFIKEVFQL